MNRRTWLLEIGTVGLSALAGCLGSERNGPVGLTGETEAPNAATVIDPDADYVVTGPEGYFSAKGQWNTDLDGVALHGFDLVTYFEEERPVAGSENHEFEFDDVTFRFATEDNRETFANEPEAYLPEFGGYCSLGVGNGYKDGMHRDAFDIIDGKLYFNLTRDIHEGWLRNYEARIETAEENWPEIKDSTDPIHIGPGIPE